MLRPGGEPELLPASAMMTLVAVDLVPKDRRLSPSVERRGGRASEATGPPESFAEFSACERRFVGEVESLERSAASVAGHR